MIADFKRCLLLTWLVLMSPIVISAEDELFLVNIDSLPQKRLVMVGFPDRTLTRVIRGGPGRSYRRRGSYQSSTWAKKIVNQLAKQHQLEVATQWPITELGEHCAVMVAPADKPLEKVLAELSSDQRLTISQPVMRYRTQMLPHRDPYFPLQGNLRQMRIDSIHSRTTGREVSIALIDTGVDLDHPDLKDQIGLYRNFIQSPSGEFPKEIHGTAMAGIIAAQSNEEGIVGVAPDVKLWPLRACWSENPGDLEAQCNSLTLALALNTAIQLHPDIINLSLTGPEDPLLRRLIEKAVDQGIIVVAAEPQQYGPESGFPADMPEVITVRQPGYIPSDPQADRKRCVAAPGEKILTTFPGATYNLISGSSASTAHISGLIALLLQVQPNLSPSDIQNVVWRAYSRQPLSVVDASMALKIIE